MPFAVKPLAFAIGASVVLPVPEKTILQAEFVELTTIWPKQANLNLFEKSMLDAPVEMSVTMGSKYPTFP